MREFIRQMLTIVVIMLVVGVLCAALSACQAGAKGGASGQLVVGDCEAPGVATWSGDLLKLTLVVEGQPHKLTFARVVDLTFALDKGSGAALEVSSGQAELGDCAKLCPKIEEGRCFAATLSSTNACLSSAGGRVCGSASKTGG